ncbi:UNVERIFIED_CONTAM: Scopoletin glucosyltransferase [Sesamum calycinum]|uniref:Scopoletin glucosyltransferase n=1 Tax=Sesamum calycinum TaxID=2727403 RepID=A0AAW2PKV6_9LAMI
MIAHGHMIPMLDMAKLFTSRGLKTTIIATPTFAVRAESPRIGHDIGLSIVQFPPKGSSLPDNIVSFDQMTTPALLPLFVEALSLLQEPVEKLLQELNPNCLLSDMFFAWTVDSAAKFDKLTFIRTQIAPFLLEEGTKNEFSKLREEMRESEKRSYGVVFNSCYELESAYADHYKKKKHREAKNQTSTNTNAWPGWTPRGLIPSFTSVSEAWQALLLHSCAKQHSGLRHPAKISFGREERKKRAGRKRRLDASRI